MSPSSNFSHSRHVTDLEQFRSVHDLSHLPQTRTSTPSTKVRTRQQRSHPPDPALPRFDAP
jgi:hypothetical protein